MAYIARVDMDKVIKLDNTVFLGHKVQTRLFAGNFRDEIAERVLVCVDPEKKDIVFDYNHRQKVKIILCIEFHVNFTM
jgi:hypothetical protein